MIEFDENFVDGVAPNSNAIKNGRGLARKGKLSKLAKDEGKTILFGQCEGSGSKKYSMSIDFLKSDAPVYRCSCPSRQFPCKHCLALLYAYAGGETFSTAEIPSDIITKRKKLIARGEKQQQKKSTPPKVNKSALRKKINSQLEGLDLLEQFIADLLVKGLGTINAKTAREMEKQGKLLANKYLPGAQAAFYEFTSLFYRDLKYRDNDLSEEERESVYSNALYQLGRLRTICKRGRVHLLQRLEDPDLQPDVTSTISEWLGHVWQLRELKELGCCTPDSEVMQLSFSSYEDTIRKQYVEEGAWLDLKSGKVQYTKNMRPFKAAKYIKEDDCVYDVLRVPELYIYPGDLNSRIRWEEMQSRKVEQGDFARIRECAEVRFSEVIKTIKNVLKEPLADRNPLCLLRFSRLGTVADRFVMEDGEGERLILSDGCKRQEMASVDLLELLPQNALNDQVMLVRFQHDLNRREITAKPLTIITSDEIIRLTL